MIAASSRIEKWPVREVASRIAIAMLFILLGMYIAGAIAVDLRNPSAAWRWASVLARFCGASFFAIVAWVSLVRSRPVAQAPGWRARVVAVLGAFLIYAVPFLPHAPPTLGQLVASTALILVCNVSALYILTRLGRSFSIMSESRRLVTSGPYAIVRHPLYLVESLGIIGVFVQFASWPGFALVLVQFAFQLRRMLNEEAVLTASFPEYRDYARRTRRLIPGVW